MIDTLSSTPKAALVVAECQLTLLAELAQMAMVVSRAFAASAVSAAQAEQAILAEEYFTPEVGRARACGAKDAAESFQKASRAVRLTMKLEMAVAETVDDLREGLPSRHATTAPNGLDVRCVAAAGGRDRERSDVPDEAMRAERSGSDRDQLVEFDRPDVLLAAPFRETVEQICDDLGATVDWARWRVEAPALKHEPVAPEPLSSPPDHSTALQPETALPP